MSGTEIILGGNTVESGPDAPAGATPAVVPAGPAPDGRPADVPEKFWDPTSRTVRVPELLKSYAESEKKLAAPPAAAPAAKPGAPIAPTAPTLSDVPDAPKVDAPKSFTPELVKKWSDEYRAGKLSDESYAELEKNHGFAREFVDSWLQGQEAIRETRRSEAFQITGSEEEYLRMKEWADGGGMEVSERDAFNTLLHSPDIAVRQGAVRGIWSRFNEAFGGSAPGRRINGNSAPGPGGSDTFGSVKEMEAAMRDKRYKNGDTAYIAEVERKVSNMRV